MAAEQDDAAATLRQLRAARLHWVELEPGLRVQFSRPLNADAAALQRSDEYATHAARLVVAWEGFSPATFLGAAVGSSDALPFNAELWAEYARDNLAAAVKVYQAAVQAVVQHNQAAGEAAKN